MRPVFKGQFLRLSCSPSFYLFHSTSTFLLTKMSVIALNGVQVRGRFDSIMRPEPPLLILIFSFFLLFFMFVFMCTSFTRPYDSVYSFLIFFLKLCFAAIN
jgi:hypothetical protein